MAANSEDSASQQINNVCRYCNKVAVSKVVKCLVCNQLVHRYCAEKKFLEVSVNKTIVCCKNDDVFGSDATTAEVDAKNDCNEVSQKDANSDKDLKYEVRRLEDEVMYLKSIIKEKDVIIEDKCTIIKDKEEIIQLQRREMDLLRDVNKYDRHRVSASSECKQLLIADKSDGQSVCASGATYAENDRRTSCVAGLVKYSPDLNPGGVAGSVADSENVTLKRTKGGCDSVQALINVNDMAGGSRESKRRSREIIWGENETDDKSLPQSTFAAAVRRAWLYVGRVRHGVVADDIKSFLEDRFENCKFVVEALPVRETARSIAFKVGADYSLLEQLKDPSLWPKGVAVKRFTFFRGKVLPATQQADAK